MDRPILLVTGDHECFPIISLARTASDLIDVQYAAKGQPLLGTGAAPEGVRWLWEQVSSTHPAVPEAELIRQLPALEARVTFSSVRFRFLWPFMGPDPRLTDGACPYPTRHIWGDRIAASIAGRELSDDDMVLAYGQACAAHNVDFSIQFRDDLESARQADRSADIGIADWLEQHWRDIAPAYSPWQVTAPLIGFVYRQLAERTLTGLELVSAHRLLDGFVGPDHEQQPINPLVAEQLGLAYGGAGQRYLLGGSLMDFREYLIDYMRLRPKCL